MKTKPVDEPNYDARKDDILKLIEPYKDNGLQISFTGGSVNFKRGVHAESVHMTTDDRIIERIVKRIACAPAYVPNKRKVDA